MNAKVLKKYPQKQWIQRVDKNRSKTKKLGINRQLTTWPSNFFSLQPMGLL